MAKTNQKMAETSRRTIYALASAPGRAGVAIMRISGPQAAEALVALGISPLPAPRRATLAKLLHPATQETIDEALLLWFPAPHSYTGEDVAELHCHGSPAVVRELAETLSSLPGLRGAEPGEFSKRAFLNGKMSLLEAEGLADLIAADTPRQKQQALKQLQGEFGNVYDQLRVDIIGILALMEAYIDFPDEDIPEDVANQAREQTQMLARNIKNQLADNHQGERIREGFRLAILGAPNVGKSTLLNRLAKRDIAITSDEPGTTRDSLDALLEIGGFPVILTDTAGLREGGGEVEQEGIRRSKIQAEAADIRLLMLENIPLAKQPREILALADENSLILQAKSDVTSPTPFEAPEGYNPLPISGKTGEGIEALLVAIEEKLSALDAHLDGPALITRQRHRDALVSALTHLEDSDGQAALELRAEHLRLAAAEIAKITGKIYLDDVLDVVFSSFCIGK